MSSINSTPDTLHDDESERNMSNPVPMFGTQDLKDNDGQVIDSFLIETDAPPDMTGAQQTIDKTPTTMVPVLTRLVPYGEQILTPTFDPVLIMPADVNRRHAYLKVVSPTAQANDGVRFGPTGAEARKGPRLVQGDAPTIDDYTGAIWVYPESVTGATNSANVAVQYWAVSQ